MNKIIFFYAIIITVYVNKFYGQGLFNTSKCSINLTIINLSIDTIHLDKIVPDLYKTTICSL
jgi:hypothetical protein